MLIDVKSSLLHGSMDHDTLLSQQIKYYQVGVNKLMNIEKCKDFYISFGKELCFLFKEDA